MSSSDSSAESLIGQLVGDFRLEVLCSDGTHYAIYRARHRKLERFAEVRVHHLQHCDSAVHLRIEQTARSISKIRHPNVVELYDYGSLENGRAYVAREWVQGVLLNELSEAPADQARSLAEVCSGLGALHEVGLAHGELSLRSVMLVSGTEDSKIVGPLLDRSEEQRRVATVEGDIADLGVLIEEVFAMPSGGVATKEGQALVPRNVGDVVRKCKATSAAERFGSVLAVAQALEKALGTAEDRDDGLAPGTLIADTYRVYAVIGAGGMGKVYEAVHKRLPQRVAIKVISGTRQPEALARFRQEAEIASSVGHPHIVRVFDFNNLPDGRPYMVMEFLEGEDLAKALVKGALPVERALIIAGQVGSALAAAHAKGIVHRDLKPPNIFLGSVDIGGTAREHATILDFGVSKNSNAEASLTRTEAMIGTPRYMAPEQAMGEHAEVGPLSDQFAMATIMYEMLTGRRCFGGRDLTEIIHSVCYVDPVPLENIDASLPAEVTAAVARAMSKSPADRFPSVAAFVAALEGRTLPTPAAKGDERSTQTSTPLESHARPIAVQDATVALKGLRNIIDAEVPATEADAAVGGATVAARPASRNAPRASAGDVHVVGKAPLSVEFAASDVAESADAEDAEAPATGRWWVRWALGGAAGAVLAAVAMFALGGESSTEKLGSESEAMGPAPKYVANAVPADASQPTAPIVMDASPPGADARLLLGETIPDQRVIPDQRTGTREKATPYPASVVATLDSAQAQLSSGKYESARKLLSRKPAAGKTPRGYAMTVMSFCGEKNFGAATDWIARVARSDRRRVRAYCKTKHGIELP